MLDGAADQCASTDDGTPHRRGSRRQVAMAQFTSHFKQAIVRGSPARFVGDTITIKITESTTASAKSNNKLDRVAQIPGSISGLTGLTGKALNGLASYETASKPTPLVARARRQTTTSSLAT
jgi:flagellar basal body L-ring protein FlgH